MTASALPDVPRLRMLNEVSIQGTLAGAARALGVTSSAVSQQISVLEREMGVQLLDRSPRGVALTGAGEVLVEHTRSILRLLEVTRAEMHQLSGELAGRVRIASIPSPARSVLLDVAQRLAVSLPDLELTVDVLEPTYSLEALLNGSVDVAIIDLYDNVPIPFPDYLVTRELLQEALVLVAPPARTFPAKVRLSDLKGERWVLPPEIAPAVRRSATPAEPWASSRTSDGRPRTSCSWSTRSPPGRASRCFLPCPSTRGSRRSTCRHSTRPAWADASSRWRGAGTRSAPS